MGRQKGIETLKQILFEEENERYVQLNARILELSNQIDERLHIGNLPSEEVNELIDLISREMPEKMGPTITRTLQSQIRKSRDDVVQALYPIIGQLIKKYIQREIKILSEKIDQRIDQGTSPQLIWARIRSWFTGVNYHDLVIRSAREPVVEEIFVVENESGLLLGNFSRSKTMDKDMISGMLTAIKAFVEDAFKKESQQLETIEYDLYKIYIQSFQKFYVAVVLSGVLTESFKNRLDEQILAFVKKATIQSGGVSEETSQEYEKYLKELFVKL